MHEHLRLRTEAIHKQLLAVHGGGDAMSNATRGSEREAFVDLLLRGCLPHPYRFGSGEVIDAHGNISGQIDLVIEHPFFPSFPLLGTSQHRLYFIEGIAVAIEVKSSQAQFQDAVSTMVRFEALSQDADWPIEAKESHTSRHGRSSVTSFPDRNAFAIVLYRGWSKQETLQEHCRACNVAVMLQLDPLMFYAANYRSEIGESLGHEMVTSGPEALLAFVFVLNEELQLLSAIQSHLFRRYVLQAAPSR